MPKIIFIDHEGTDRQIDADTGDTLMQAAIKNNIPGIEAECGGACSCATCHVYINDAWAAQVGPAGDIEADMLDIVAEKKTHSRLACQVSLTDAMEGLTVSTPESQY